MASRSGDEFAEGMAGMAIVLTILVVAITIWLTVKATELVARVMVAHPENRAMWVLLGTFLLTSLAAALTEGRYPVLVGLAAAALTVLLVTAKVLEIYYDQFLQTERTRDDLVNEVFHEPWWNAA